jgi:hypothetical protein
VAVVRHQAGKACRCLIDYKASSGASIINDLGGEECKELDNPASVRHVCFPLLFLL